MIHPLDFPSPGSRPSQRGGMRPPHNAPAICPVTLIASHRGRIFDTASDSVVADFASAVDAVRCAVAVQAAIATENAAGAALFSIWCCASSRFAATDMANGWLAVETHGLLGGVFVSCRGAERFALSEVDGDPKLVHIVSAPDIRSTEGRGASRIRPLSRTAGPIGCRPICGPREHPVHGTNMYKKYQRHRPQPANCTFAGDIAALYDRAGDQYLVYAGRDPGRLFCFDGLQAYADRQLWSLSETKLTTCGLPGQAPSHSRCRLRTGCLAASLRDARPPARLHLLRC